MRDKFLLFAVNEDNAKSVLLIFTCANKIAFVTFNHH